ncbi:MAG: tetratricopeptide repeat protein [Chloroflexi bacterium]|nr:tetratricopeptide repeat protein [Chloroflexota bacterium]
MPAIQVMLLGVPQVEWAGQLAPHFRSKKTAALLAYLIVADRPVARDHLAALFWSDSPKAEARAHLRRALHNLTSLLPGCLAADWQTAEFVANPDCRVDVLRFQELERRGDDLAQVEVGELCRGAFLEGLYLDDCPEFEAWLMTERERWQQKCFQALGRLLQQSLSRGEYEAGLRYARRLLALDPWHEEAHRQMMSLLARTGQLSAALKQYATCRRILAKELGVEPAAETTRLYERIKSARVMPPTRLPAPAAPFVGREEELATLQQYLADPNCRLLTLTGVGGIGKSRLALETATRQVAAGDFRLFLHGVAFVPLVGVDAQDLTAALGAALGLAFTGQEPAERQLLRYLADKELLLLLDNYEHLLPETVLLAAILREAPDVKLLVTSRERLGLWEEWLFEVEGLPYPPETAANGATGEGKTYASMRLFERQARRVRRDFSLAAANNEVGQICRLLQGMPLALELSAARLKSLAPAVVLAELDRGLDALTAETSNVSARHASLRVVFDASWVGLSSQEQDVLRRVSLFRGGFTRPAGAEVAGATVSILSRLANKSLIRLLPSGRYELHELLRQYAAEQLAADPALKEATEVRYATYYGAFLAEREQRLLETDQERALHEIDPEMDNIRLAWRAAVERQKLDVLERGLWTLGFYYVLRGWTAEGQEVMESTLAALSWLEKNDPAHARLLARLCLFQGFCLVFHSWIESTALLQQRLRALRRFGTPQDAAFGLFVLGEGFTTILSYEEAVRALREGAAIAGSAGLRALEALNLARLSDTLSLAAGKIAGQEAEESILKAVAVAEALDNPFALGIAYHALGRLARLQQEYREAQVCFERSLAALKRIEPLWFMTIIKWDLVQVNQWLGHSAAAWQHRDEGQHWARRCGYYYFELVFLYGLGELARQQGDIRQAKRAYHDCLRACEEAGHIAAVAIVRSKLGQLLLSQGNDQEARLCFSQSLPIVQAMAAQTSYYQDLAWMNVAGIAGLVAAADAQEATRLLGAAGTHLQWRGVFYIWPADLDDWERLQAEVRGQLDEASFAAAWAAGQAMSPDEAIELALALL